MTFMLTSCTKEYKSSALLEMSVRGSTNSEVDSLQNLGSWLAQYDINLPEETTITRLRQSRLIQIQSVADDPVAAADRANDLAKALENIPLDNTDGVVFKVVEKAVPSSR